MNADFWLERWQNNEIGFHQAEYNASLSRHWSHLNIAEGSTVFVPLCGKSDDMVFLAQQGCQVIGAELSDIAVREFFAEQELSPSQRVLGDLTVYQDGPFTLYSGDLFSLQAEHLQHCQAVYDRASVIALPTAMREQYAQHLSTLLPVDCATLLITLEYPQGDLTGPPFSVDQTEVQRLFCQHWEIEELGHCAEDIRGKAAVERSYKLLKKDCNLTSGY